MKTYSNSILTSTFSKRIIYLFIIMSAISVLLTNCKKNLGVPVPIPVPELTITSISAINGLRNSAIIIKGSNFSNIMTDNIVKFNGIVAVVDSANSTRLLVTVPALATTGKISVTVNSKTATSAADFKLLSGSVTNFYDKYIEVIAVDVNSNLYGSDYVSGAFNSPNLAFGVLKISNAGVAGVFAGGATSGFFNGNGSSARMDVISGIATDASGNVFVADDNRIRKISPTGGVSTIAGGGAAGFADGQGTGAKFNYPVGLTVDALGNIYVCDSGNHRVRKITPGGLVSTLAGNGIAGNVNGNNTSAQFSGPDAIVIDASGNLFVGDYQNFNIRKITPTGVVTTFAGSGVAGFVNGTGTKAQFFYPQGMAIDAAGNIFISDSDYNDNIYYVRMVNKAGFVSTFLGDRSKGTLRDAQINYTVNFPDGLAFDPHGNMYFTNTGLALNNVGGSYISKVTFHY